MFRSKFKSAILIGCIALSLGMSSISSAQSSSTTFSFGFNSHGHTYGSIDHRSRNFNYDFYHRSYDYRSRNYYRRGLRHRQYRHTAPPSSRSRAYRHGYKFYDCDYYFDEYSQRYKKVCR